jgi:hypothetical protein
MQSRCSSYSVYTLFTFKRVYWSLFWFDIIHHYKLKLSNCFNTLKNFNLRTSTYCYCDTYTCTIYLFSVIINLRNCDMCNERERERQRQTEVVFFIFNKYLLIQDYNLYINNCVILRVEHIDHLLSR